jgi:hypothetical protein
MGHGQENPSYPKYRKTPFIPTEEEKQEYEGIKSRDLVILNCEQFNGNGLGVEKYKWNTLNSEKLIELEEDCRECGHTVGRYEYGTGKATSSPGSKEISCNKCGNLIMSEWWDS